MPAPVEVTPARDLPAVMADLRERGIRALGSEGGPRLLRSLVGAGLIDELFLTAHARCSPATRTRSGSWRARSCPTHAPLGLEWVLERDGELFLRYSVGSRA